MPIGNAGTSCPKQQTKSKRRAWGKQKHNPLNKKNTPANINKPNQNGTLWQLIHIGNIDKTYNNEARTDGKKHGGTQGNPR